MDLNVRDKVRLTLGLGILYETRTVIIIFGVIICGLYLHQRLNFLDLCYDVGKRGKFREGHSVQVRLTRMGGVSGDLYELGLDVITCKD